MFKQLYKLFLFGLLSTAEHLHGWKTWFAEWFAIFRKRKLYKHIRWTSEQKKEFDEFWLKHYGKKISPRWHKLYQSFNGIFDVRYFPEILYTTKLELKLNPFLLCQTLADKSLTELLYSGSLIDGNNDRVRVPKTFGLRSGNYFYDDCRKIVSASDLYERLSNIGPAVVKPTVGGASGKGVVTINIQNSIEQKSGRSLSELLETYGPNWIVQEKLKQCPAVAAIYNDSINTFRVTTYICDNKVFHVPIALRIGSGGSQLDNIHAGGMGVGVRDDGRLLKYAYRLGYGCSDEKFSHHPDSGIIFDSYFIPCIDKVIQTAYSLHRLTPGVGIISWDIILDWNESPVVIEANFIAQGLWFPQIINCAPLFGDHTEKMISLLRKSTR